MTPITYMCILDISSKYTPESREYYSVVDVGRRGASAVGVSSVGVSG